MASQGYMKRSHSTKLGMMESSSGTGEFNTRSSNEYEYECDDDVCWLVMVDAEGRKIPVGNKHTTPTNVKPREDIDEAAEQYLTEVPKSWSMDDDDNDDEPEPRFTQPGPAEPRRDGKVEAIRTKSPHPTTGEFGNFSNKNWEKPSGLRSIKNDKYFDDNFNGINNKSPDFRTRYAPTKIGEYGSFGNKNLEKPSGPHAIRNSRYFDDNFSGNASKSPNFKTQYAPTRIGEYGNFGNKNLENPSSPHALRNGTYFDDNSKIKKGSLSTATNDIDKIVEQLKGAAKLRVGIGADTSRLRMPQPGVGIPMRDGNVKTTIDSNEATRRYRDLNWTYRPTKPVENYGIIDSTEAARRYGGSLV